MFSYLKFLFRRLYYKGSMELVSVIIPVYNSEKYIEEALTSLKNQTYKNFEVIIVNDGSTDDSLGVIAKTVNNDKRFKVYTIENSGPGYARNFGISKAHGKYLTFMDNDDIVHPVFIGDMVKELTTSCADVCFCYAQDFDENGSYDIKFPKYKKDFYKLDENMRNSLSSIFFPPWTKLIRTDFIKKYKIFFSLNNKFDDVLYHFLIIHFANTVVFCNKKLYKHRLHSASISIISETKRDMYFDHFKTCKDIYNFSKHDPIMCKAMIRRFIDFLYKYAHIAYSTEEYVKICDELSNAQKAGDYHEIGRILQRF